MESPQVLSDQLPPDILLTSDDPKDENVPAAAPGSQNPPSSTQDNATRSAEAASVMESGEEAADSINEADVSDMDQDHPESPSKSADKSVSPPVRIYIYIYYVLYMCGVVVVSVLRACRY